MSDYRELEERLRELVELREGVTFIVDEDLFRSTADAIKALWEENERLRADAERYRWICGFPEEADYAITHALNGCDGTGDGPSFRDLLSDAIDAALAAKGET